MFLKKLHNFKFFFHLKDKFFAFISFLAGLVFLFGHLLNDNNIDIYSNLLQWTTQSNLIAFIVVFFYLFLSKTKIFKTNFLILFAGNNLFIAGIGFWLILYPTVFIGLPNYVLPLKDVEKETQLKFLSLFFYFWNHVVTQILYFIFMIFAFKESTDTKLQPIKFRTLCLAITIWTTIFILFFGIVVSLFTNLFPVYGIYTNFNPHTKFYSSDGEKLFNTQLLISGTIGVYFFGFLIAFWNWRISIQLNKTTAKKLLKNI